MDEIELLDLRAVCRACALPFPSTVLRDITPPTRDMLAFCTGLEMDLMSEMPTRVCGTCLSRADDASQFKMQCLRSEEKLRACVAALRPIGASTPFTASTPAGASTPIAADADVADAIPTPNCSIRSEISDFDLPLTPLGCKIDEILNEGASPACEESSNMTKFMNAILDEGHYDSQKKIMIINEIINAQMAPLPSSTPMHNCKNMASLLTEKHINASSNEVEKSTSHGKNIESVLNENEKVINIDSNLETNNHERMSDTNLHPSSNEVEKRNIPGKKNYSMVNENEEVMEIDFSLDTNSHRRIFNTKKNSSPNEVDKRNVPSKNIESVVNVNEEVMEVDSSQEPNNHHLISNMNKNPTPNEVDKRTVPSINIESVLNKNEEQIDSNQKPNNYQLISNADVIRDNKRIPYKCHVKVIDILKRAMPERLVYKSLKQLNFVRCRYCFFVFLESRTLYEHLKDEHVKDCMSDHGADYISLAMPEHSLIPELTERNCVRCWFCDFRLRDVEKLYRHLNKDHKWQCKTNCDGIDYVRRAMPEKSSSMELDKLGFVRCRFCYLPYEHLPKLYQHLRNQHFSECRQCKDGYDYIKMAMPEDGIVGYPKNCRYCRFKFISVERLYKHLQRMHDHDCQNTWLPGSHSKHYACDECGRQFARRIYIIKHLAVHERKKNPTATRLYCKKCKRSFKSVPNQLAHMQTHKLKSSNGSHRAKSQGSHLCVTCGKSYSTASNLRAHARTHAPEQRLPCPHCARVFPLPDSLARHLKTHGKKSYKCNECSKMFSRSDHLARHYRIHTGEKPYMCAECGKRFNQPNMLRMHMRRSHIDFRSRRVAEKRKKKTGKTGTKESTLQCDNDNTENVPIIEMPLQNGEIENFSTIELTLQYDEIGNVPNIEMALQNYETGNGPTSGLTLQNYEIGNVPNIEMPLQNINTENVPIIEMPLQEDEIVNVPNIKLIFRNDEIGNVTNIAVTFQNEERENRTVKEFPVLIREMEIDRTEEESFQNVKMGNFTSE